MGWIDRMDRWDGQTGRIDGMDGTVQLACNDAKGYGLRSDAMRKYALAHRHAPWDMHRRVGVNSKPRWQSVGAMSDYFGPIRAGEKQHVQVSGALSCRLNASGPNKICIGSALIAYTYEVSML